MGEAVAFGNSFCGSVILPASMVWAARSGTKFVLASNTSEQRPHRTQPLDILSKTGTTLNEDLQAGHRVVKFITQQL